MKSKISRLFRMCCITLFLMVISCALPAERAQAETVKLQFNVSASYTKAFRLLKLVNKERKAQGLTTLKIEKNLMEAAALRAEELVISRSSTRPNGKGCLTAQPALAYGENYAYGYQKAAAVLQSWMNSASHKANLLRGDFKSVGVAVIRYEGHLYWVMEFGISIYEKASASAYTDQSVSASVQVNTDSSAWQPIISLSQSVMKTGESAALELSWGNGYINLPSDNLKVTNLTPKIISVSGNTVYAVTAGTGKLKVYLPGYKAGALTLKVKVKQSANSVPIKLVPNGGSLTGKRRSVTVGQPYGTLPVPTREGYTFLGWYTKRSAGSLVTEETIVTKAKAHYLYAHWKK